jgi:hypothetical protein
MLQRKIGIELTVTYRANVKTSSPEDWRHISIDEYLDIIEYDKELESISDKMADQFNLIEGLFSEEMLEDYVTIPLHQREPFRSEYRLSKRLLPCVNYFISRYPPSNTTNVDGKGNGIVVLDVDIKHLGEERGIPSPFKEKLDELVENFFINHASSIFLYETSSRQGYHIGFLTDATNAKEYKLAFKQLADQLADAVPFFRTEGVIDKSVGRYNADFFTNHSRFVFRKKPETVFIHDRKETSEPATIREVLDDQEKYDDFPYHTDFRLFLAYIKRDRSITYFDDRGEWLRMMFALKAEYPICYRPRIYQWFRRLSSLSPKYNVVNDDDFFAAIMDSETDTRTGIEFIVKVLHNGESASQTPQYKWDDLRNYFDDLDEEDFTEARASNFLFIGKYLTEIKHVLNFSQNIIIESPPNTGKSTLLLEEVSFKRIYLVPTKILLTDLKKKVPSAQIVQERVLSDEIQSKEIILSTYEGLEKILASKINLSEYTLIVDEAHNIFLSASPAFRFLSLHRICSSFQKFKNTILLSGTWIDLPFSSDIDFTLIRVKQRNPIFTELNIINTETPLDNLSSDVASETGKQIVLVNNKDENNELRDLVRKRRPNAPITLMNADTKTKEDVKQVLKDNHLQPGHVLIGTQMIVEGISFLDDDIAAMRFYRGMAAELIAQLSFRARKSHVKPPISFYQARKEFFLKKESDLLTVYRKLQQDNASKNLMSLASEYIGNSHIRVFYDRRIENGKARDIYTPLIYDEQLTNQVHTSKILLGYLSLEKVTEAMGADLFSLLAALRKWNLIFNFTTLEKTNVREDFKKQRADEQRSFISERFHELSDYTYDEVSQNKKSPIYRAWTALQCIDITYFNQLDTEKRIELFFDKKAFRQFCDLIQGCAILKGRQFFTLAEFVSPTFYENDVKVLTSIQNINGFPAKISNRSLEDIPDLLLTKNERKKVLKKYFMVSEATPQKDDKNVSVRFFGLRRKDLEFEPYLKIENSQSYESDRPF